MNNKSVMGEKFRTRRIRIFWAVVGLITMWLWGTANSMELPIIKTVLGILTGLFFWVFILQFIVDLAKMPSQIAQDISDEYELFKSYVQKGNVDFSKYHDLASTLVKGVCTKCFHPMEHGGKHKCLYCHSKEILRVSFKEAYYFIGLYKKEQTAAEPVKSAVQSGSAADKRERNLP